MQLSSQNRDRSEGRAAHSNVTIVVPSYNQGCFLDEALTSIFAQNVSAEVFVMDGGSKDETIEVLKRWEDQLAGWRSGPDDGQAAAINEGIARGTADYVAWLNSDDFYLPGGLARLIAALEHNTVAPAAYGNTYDEHEKTGRRTPIWVQPFGERALAQRCIVSQPGTLIRRSAWEVVGGVDPSLFLAMDYDLWWRLYHAFGPLAYVPEATAVNRVHHSTKTRNNRVAHYAEAIAVVRRHHGRVPMKWWLAQPYAVWWKALVAHVNN